MIFQFVFFLILQIVKEKFSEKVYLKNLPDLNLASLLFKIIFLCTSGCLFELGGIPVCMCASVLQNF